MNSGLYLDFHDSFSWNVIDLFSKNHFKLSRHSYKDIQNVVDSKSAPELIVLGPGPGHPNDYFEVIDHLRPLFEQGRTFFVGVCLGHQILGILSGGKVVSSKEPMHGCSVEVSKTDFFNFAGSSFPQRKFNNEALLVQRYNSLVLHSDEDPKKSYLYDKNGEILAIKGQNFLSYQFHPESVGSSFPSAWFLPIENSLYYNTKDGPRN
ncbi:MAG: aminodeoxychorismate/anthranilate synthase component II [Bacteriovoracaceae bacterium]